jgi:type IV pilus assembly protein PilM
MFIWPFGKKSGPQLGIDIGASAIKVVELSKKENRLCLSNYALAQIKEGALFRTDDIKTEELAKILKNLLRVSGFSSRRASLSLPLDRTFSIIIEMPFMPDKELAAAIPYEARKYVPVPLDEVILDWSVIYISEKTAPAKPAVKEAPIKQTADEGQSLKPQDATANGVVLEAPGATNAPPAKPKTVIMQVLIVAVPKAIIERLTNIAKLAGLRLKILEQEAFSLARSLLGNDKNIYLVVDLGYKSTDLTVVDEGFIRLTHNLEAINKEVVLMEIDRIVNLYQMKYNKKVGQCLLVGGRSGDKEMVDFLQGKLKVPLKIGDPFARISYDEKVGPLLQKLGPQMAVAVGLAMRES